MFQGKIRFQESQCSKDTDYHADCGDDAAGQLSDGDPGPATVAERERRLQPHVSHAQEKCQACSCVVQRAHFHRLGLDGDRSKINGFF